jgi:hypothetical protein
MPVAPHSGVRVAGSGHVPFNPGSLGRAKEKGTMKLRFPLLAAALVLGTVAFAEPRPDASPEPKPNTNPNADQGAYNQNPATSTAGLTMTKGQVVSSDARSNTLVVKVDKGPGTTTPPGSTQPPGMSGTSANEMAFVVGPDTKILKGSKKASLAEISGGDKVTVNYKMVGGKFMAVSIGIEPAA